MITTQSSIKSFASGDEAQCANASWMYVTWTCDISPHLTDSAASRMLIAVVPADRYILDPATGINLTLQTLYLHIAKSCNKLSQEGVKISDPVTHQTVVRLATAMLFVQMHVLILIRILCWPVFPRSWVEVVDVRAYVTGFRGDWKALKQTFNFTRYADQDAATLLHCSRTPKRLYGYITQ